MESMRPRLTLTQVFVLTFGGVAVVVVGLFSLQLESARRQLVARSEQFREAAAARVEARITRDLDEASDVLGDVERAVRVDAIDARSPESAEAPLFALLLGHPKVSDVALTSPARWQISVYRASDDPRASLVTRVVRPENGHFVAEVKTRFPGATIHDGTVVREETTDPTAHLTYATTVSDDSYGELLRSDLHPSELDRGKPVADQRIVVTVQKAIDDAAKKPAGVVRVGLLASTVDEIATMRVDEADPHDPHRVVVCDAEGRLLTRLSRDDRLAPVGDDLRVAPARLDPAIARALASPALRTVSEDEHPLASDAFVVDGRRWLATFRALGHTQGWIAAIVVPEDHYTRDLRALRDRFVMIDALGALVALVGGGLLLVGVRGGLRRLLATTARMREFELAADPRPAALRDVDEVVQGLERAKTAMRAMGKYVPMDLVRELYASNKEPELGGELRELTVLFTDLRGFTDLAETIPPDALARALGHYLDAMTEAIRATGGTIDKFIGDSVMAIWNAPGHVEDHATRACRAILACEEATAKLYASPAWKGLPPLVTRFGVHTDRVMVGHFGAPARISYTALGDGVNLASRLEGLGKQYGVTRIVSEAVAQGAGGAFALRKLDRVAVKGKSRAVLVYELLGPRDAARAPIVAAYEAALEGYFARRFDDAIAQLDPHCAHDSASRVLVDRCRAFLAEPPPADWDGSWVASSK
jgi:adenylate cyclase